jgi:hypothetical protein
MYTLLMPELMQLDMGTSMSRYAPPIGTAGFDRVFVNGYKREPAPPPKMMAATDFVFDIADTLVSFCATASERMTRWILLSCVLHQYRQLCFRYKNIHFFNGEGWREFCVSAFVF